MTPNTAPYNLSTITPFLSPFVFGTTNSTLREATKQKGARRRGRGKSGGGGGEGGGRGEKEEEAAGEATKQEEADLKQI